MLLMKDLGDLSLPLLKLEIIVFSICCFTGEVALVIKLHFLSFDFKRFL